VSKDLVVPGSQIVRTWRARARGLLGSAAIHVTLVVALALIPNRSRDPVGHPITVSVQVPEELSASPNDVTLVPEASNRDVAVDDVGGSPQSARFDIDFEKIAARRDALFPFVTTDMGFLDRISGETRANESGLANPFGAQQTTAADLPPLRISDEELQRTIDRSWSRRSRWNAFAEIAGLLRTHDTDTGQIPTVLRAYLDQNLLQLFCDTSAGAPGFWAMVENAADHIDFIEFVREFTRDHPSSFATTELLFLLDKLAQASRDTLLLLVDTESEPEAVPPPAANDGHELALRLRDHYRERLQQRQVQSPEDIRDWYDRLRLRILSTVIATSPDGYRVSDARFLIGQIYFEQGNVTEAHSWWKDIRHDSGDSYAEAYCRLLDELRRPDGVRMPQIKYVLQSVVSQWRNSSMERLRHFGRTCDSY
jgi:hypothetical protein